MQARCGERPWCCSSRAAHRQRVVPQLLLARSLDREQAGDLPGALGVLTTTFDENPDESSGKSRTCSRMPCGWPSRPGDKDTAQTVAGQAATLAEGSEIPHQQANALYCRGMVDRDALGPPGRRAALRRRRAAPPPGQGPGKPPPSASWRPRSGTAAGRRSSRPSRSTSSSGRKRTSTGFSQQSRAHGIRSKTQLSKVGCNIERIADSQQDRQGLS